MFVTPLQDRLDVAAPGDGDDEEGDEDGDALDEEELNYYDDT